MQRRTVIFSLLMFFSILGVIDAGYLAFMAFAGEAPNCFLKVGCDLVAASPYSRVFGIPLALFGVFFYTLVGGFALWGFLNKATTVNRYLLPVTALGFLLSLYFLYLQAAVIGAYCEYCLISLFTSTVLFALSFFALPARRAGSADTESTSDAIVG